MATAPTTTATAEPAAPPAPKPPTPAEQRETLLLLLATDWLAGDRTHNDEIRALVAALTPPAA